jgi:hypothetical protein
MGRREVLQKLDFPVEVNQECYILRLQHFVQKAVAGGAFLVQNTPLAHARVHKQAEREREIRLSSKISDGSRTTIFLEGEVVLGQVADHLAVLVANRGQHVDRFDVDRNRGCLAA